MKGVSIDINIKETSEEITALIMRELAKELNIRIKATVPKIEKQAGELLRQYIKLQPEWGAITGETSRLRYELGIVDPMARMLNIVDVLVRNVKAKFTPFTVSNTNFLGGIQLGIVDSDYSSILGLPDGVVITDLGEPLHWLRWLLMEGNSIIITTHRVSVRPYRSPKPSRTGGAIMIKGGKWRVPAEFSGRLENNFITRAVKDMKKPLEEIIKECITSA